MNTTTKLSAAVALGLCLMGASLAADAASAAPAAKAQTTLTTGAPSHGQARNVIHLGTIKVTAADAEGARQPKRNYGSTAYLGRVEVTADDSAASRAAAATAAKQGAFYLGAVTVTNADSEDARVAANLADEPGTLYLGAVTVTARDAKAPVLGGVMAVISALVFARMGG
ncbi:MAG TPA: hypothetical protein VHP13_06190 [Gammaproteobacteria bacterium]|jgi:hypothetical protein|nr:hypothetical protein [Gammaproteobacteria bacterium]